MQGRKLNIQHNANSELRLRMSVWETEGVAFIVRYLPTFSNREDFRAVGDEELPF